MSKPTLTLTKFTLYETKTRFYIIGTDSNNAYFRILKIDRTEESGLNILDDGVIYTREEIEMVLRMIEDGNKTTGGVNRVCIAVGIGGFIRFTEGYYLLLITKKSNVAILGGHSIFHIDETKLISITNPAVVRVEKNIEEARYIQTFQAINLHKNFYFSYTYDLTHSLQYNMTWNLASSNPRSMALDMFVWNYSLLRSGKPVNAEIGGLKCSVWMVNIIHGFVDQAKISVFGRPIYVTLIARRSRHFAGARFHKRGVNSQGFVANEVETEQIVHDASTTTPPLLPDKLKIITERYNRHYTSFVQHRGSIPLYWSQDTSNMAPKPPIELNIRDPFFSASALHFDSLFQRYGAPVIILNLIKNKEKTKRESILGDEFAQAVEYLNQFLPQEMNIKYIAWDMSRASKTGQDVIGILENIAEQVVLSTGFFHSGPEPYVNTLKRGEGYVGRCKTSFDIHLIMLTNCIDCLDRTNAAQFVIGKCAFAHQLYALGAIPHPFLPFDTDATNMLTEMYQDHGDTIALQYGGSHLVNTMDTYRKSNWASHGRDMVETIRRYYSNTVTDAEKQEAINLFLGNFGPKGRNYIDWWTKRYLLPPATTKACIEPWKKGLPENANEDYFKEYYRPRQFTSMSLLFAFNMMSTMKYAA
ncbi:SacI homology domain-containing protein [Paraphysoderma sedebokerense]|nr:SacI homology domain-containing protein [Paraphysoderma sedebokerense]